MLGDEKQMLVTLTETSFGGTGDIVINMDLVAYIRPSVNGGSRIFYSNNSYVEVVEDLITVYTKFKNSRW